jgi:hypothetical protein
VTTAYQRVIKVTMALAASPCLPNARHGGALAQKKVPVTVALLKRRGGAEPISRDTVQSRRTRIDRCAHRTLARPRPSKQRGLASSRSDCLPRTHKGQPSTIWSRVTAQSAMPRVSASIPSNISQEHS